MWGPGGVKLGALTMTRKRFDVIKAMLSTETPQEESQVMRRGWGLQRVESRVGAGDLTRCETNEHESNQGA